MKNEEEKLIEELKEYSECGMHCNHEIVKKHYIVFESDIEDVKSKAFRSGKLAGFEMCEETIKIKKYLYIHIPELESLIEEEKKKL